MAKESTRPQNPVNPVEKNGNDGFASRLGQMKTAIFIFGGGNPEVVNLLVAVKSLKC